MYYTPDETARTTFDTKVGTENPIVNTLIAESGTKTDDGSNKEDIPGLNEHFYEYINKHKVVDIIFGMGVTNTTPGNWKTFGGGSVHKNVLLFPENLNFDFSVDEKYEDVISAIKGQTGFLAKAEQGMELMRLAKEATSKNTSGPPAGGKFISKYSKLPYWSGGSGIKGPQSLKFNFTFGQAGLFSGEEEVVRPILALAACFAPFSMGGKFPNYLKGPMPTINEYLVKVAVKIAGSITTSVSEAAANAINNISFKMPAVQTPPAPPPTEAQQEADNKAEKTAAGEKAVGAFNDAVEKLTTMQQNLLTGIDSAITEVISEQGGDMSVFHIRCGMMTIGPFYAGNTKWNFDFSHTDEEGFPSSGSITIGGIETFEIADRNMVHNTFPLSSVKKAALEKQQEAWVNNTVQGVQVK